MGKCVFFGVGLSIGVVLLHWVGNLDFFNNTAYFFQVVRYFLQFFTALVSDM